jgi:hypothetical protein
VRTTLTLDPDVEALVKKAMERQGIGLKRAINDGLRAGLGARAGAPFASPTYDMGRPVVPLDHALQLAGAMEDEELLRRIAASK